MSNEPRLTPLAASLPATVPFVGPEAQERRLGRPFAARLGANESGFGPSPAVIAAIREAAAGSWMYADPEAHDLRHAVAELHGIDPAHVMIGEGIDTLLGLIARLTVTPGVRVVTSDGAYPTFNFHVVGYGGDLIRVPYNGDHEDPQALIAAAKASGARLIYISNPDNPMGSWHPAPVIEAMVAAVPDGALLLLDEAYVELAPEGVAVRIDPADPRVLRFRTFSKAHGLAGARVGYAIGPKPLIAAFDRVRNHFGMNRAGQIGALAAVQDSAWLDHVREQVTKSRGALARIAVENGLVPLPSATNFVTMDCGGEGALSTLVLEELAARGIFVRKPMVAPHDRCIRISCAGPAEMALFATALPEALAAAHARHSVA